MMDRRQLLDRAARNGDERVLLAHIDVYKRQTLYLRLYWEFFKTGLFAIGGGMATLPFLKDIGATTGWFSQTDLMNMLAVSESTPGPVGINMAT